MNKKQRYMQRRYMHWLRCQKRRLNWAWQFHCPCCDANWLYEWQDDIFHTIAKWQNEKTFID